MLNENILMGGFRYNYGGWTFEHIGKNIWKIYPTVEPNSVTMTGADVTRELYVGFMHRLLRMHFFHTDSSYAASTDSLLVRIERSAGTLNPSRFEEYIYNNENLIKSRISLIFRELNYEASLWKFTFNTTTTDLIFPVIYLENRSVA